MPTLNSKVLVANRNGVKEEATVRDVITLGQGKAFETLKALDCFESLLVQLKKEQERPLDTLSEELRVARKIMEKAKWWVTTGVYMLTPTDKEVLEAQGEYERAHKKWQEVYHALCEETQQHF
jgi:hypothetical protein